MKTTIFIILIFAAGINLQANNAHQLIHSSVTVDSLIPYPWSQLDMTDVTMKPGYPFTAKSGIWPYLIGIPVGGAAVYLFTRNKSEATGCAFSVQSEITSSICGLPNGAIALNIFPEGNYDINWSNGLQGNIISGLASGSYSVTISTINGECNQNLNLTVPDEDLDFTVSVNTSNAKCMQADGTAEINITPEGPYQIVWPDGGTDANRTDLAMGSYMVTVSQGDCSQTQSIVIEESGGDFTISTSGTDADCGQSNGTAQVNAEPPGNYAFLWSNGENTPTISDLPADEYFVTVSDSNGCSQTSSISIEELQADFDIQTETTDASCGTSDGQGSITVTPDGSYSYTWPDGTTDNTNANLSAGNFTVTVTDNNGCSQTTDIIIEELPADFQIDIKTTPAHCGLSDGQATATITPVDNYTYLWSDGTSGNPNTVLPKGSHTLTVTNDEGCQDTQIFDIGTMPSNLFNATTPSPGDCINDGNITIDITMDGEGPIILTLINEGQSSSVNLPTGTHPLEDYFAIPPGDYLLTAYDQLAGIGCSDSIMVNVPDTTIQLTAVNDTFQTSNGEVLNDNMISNDTGYHIKVLGIDSIIGGNVSFVADGTFAFIPDDDFEGTGGFQYIVADTCGRMDTAMVFVEVTTIICMFDAFFESDNASCGDNDGSISVQPNQPGNYSYVWENGITGPQLDNVFAGPYEVTITDLDLNCALVFTGEVDEDPPQYITDIEIMQPDCNFDANIIFELEEVPGRAYTIEVFHPGGDDEFEVEGGVIFLGDYIFIAEGDYTITVWDTNIGYPCLDGFEATINPMEGILIEVLDITPTSSPSAMDGSVTVEIISGGVPPYLILLDGLVWSTTSSNVFTISELASSAYMIQVLDDNECPSNMLEVFVPFETTMQFVTGPSLVHLVWRDYQPEHPADISLQNIALGSRWSYSVLGQKHQTSIWTLSREHRQKIYWQQTIQLHQLLLDELQLAWHIGAVTAVDHVQQPRWLIRTDFDFTSDIGTCHLELGAIIGNGSILPFTGLQFQFGY